MHVKRKFVLKAVRVFEYRTPQAHRGARLSALAAKLGLQMQTLMIRLSAPFKLDFKASTLEHHMMEWLRSRAGAAKS